jgi:Flp pilus assembly protein TadG
MSAVPSVARPAGLVRRLGALARRTDGAAMIEFAFVAPVLLTVICVIVDFGRLLFVISSLTAAVRDGARSAAVLTNPLDLVQTTTVQQRVVSGFQPLGGPALTVANVAVTTDAATNAGVVSTVTVRISNYTFRPITPFASTFGLAQVALSRAAVFRWERSS